MHVAEAKRTLGSRIPWLCDTRDPAMKNAFGRAPNSEWLIDPDGVVLARHDWSDPAALRDELARVLGPVDPPTRVEDLNLPTRPPPEAAPSGVVARLQRPERMTPLQVQPKATDGAEPLYAKLRVECTPELLEGKPSRLLMTFGLDQLYHVHWNNLTTEPISVRVEGPDSAKIEPSILRGPDVDVETDVDPREFLIEVSGIDKGDTLSVRVHYFVCNDEQGWCKPIDQAYTVTIDEDPDAGRVIPKEMIPRLMEMMEKGVAPRDADPPDR
jgi:hypothetical protein